MKLAAITLIALLSPTLFAQADVNALLDSAAAVKEGESADWIAARDAIVALGEEAVPALREAAAERTWTSEGWVRAMAAEACRVRIEDPELAAQADSPRGLNPERYKLFRKPMPVCQNELRDLGRDVVPLLLERWRWTFGSFPFSEGADGEAERKCFALAILWVPGELKDRRARHMLEAALRDATLGSEWRQQAAVALGKCAGTDGLTALTDLYDDATQPSAVREGCAWAIGRVADIKAADALETRLQADGLTAELRRALLTGVSILGSSWAWRARGPMHELRGNEIREKCARMAVEALKTAPEDQDLISRALNMTAWQASLDWVADLAENGETRDVKLAASECLEPLRTALQRNRK